jgi:HAD superfamily hydrolase (TIGR01509 family)
MRGSTRELSPPPPELRGVVFDMDGVLVDSHAAHRQAWRLFLHALGRDMQDSDLEFILDGRKRIDILRHLFGDLPECELQEFGRRKDSIFRQIQLTVSPVRGAVRLVDELHQRGALLAVATSASRSRAHATLAQLGMRKYFKAVVTGDDVLRGKPDPAVYLLASDRLRIEKRHLLAVEDAVSGVQAAVAAGIACIGIALHELPKNLIAAGAVHVVPDFKELTSSEMEKMLLDRNIEACRREAAGALKS